MLSFHKPQKNVNLNSMAFKIKQDCNLTIGQSLEVLERQRPWRPAGCSPGCLRTCLRLSSPIPVLHVSVRVNYLFLFQLQS